MESVKRKVYLGVGADSYAEKAQLLEVIKGLGCAVIDLGAFEIDTQIENRVLAREVAEKVLEQEESAQDKVGVLVMKDCASALATLADMREVHYVLSVDSSMALMAKEKKAQVLCLQLSDGSLEEVLEMIKIYLS